MASQNNEDENLTVSTVYETLKSRNFLNDLYWDAISSIKDKPAFLHMREITEKIIKKKTDMIETMPEMSVQAKKGIIAEICSMSYTIDAVYSKILYMKLDKYFKERINVIVEDLIEGKLSEKISSKIQVSSNLGECSSTINTKSMPQQKETEKEPQHEKRKQSIRSCNNSKLGHQRNITENKANYGAKKLSKKDIEDSIKASKTVTKKTVTSPIASSSKRKWVDEAPAVSKNTAVIAKPENEEEISDTESDISVGHLSIASVSSVHTSDLSSFDDEISIGSEDEGRSKKRLSLKYLQQLCENGLPKLEKITNGIKPKEPTNGIKPKEPTNGIKPKESTNGIKSKEPTNIIKPKEPTNVIKPKEPTIAIKPKVPTNAIKPKESQKEIKVSPEKVTPNTTESTSSESSIAVTSKRIRKPNSKYSSDNHICQSVRVKERKKQPDVSPKKTSEKDSSYENSPKEKKRLRSESSEIGIPSKMQKLDTAEKEKNEKSASKKNETSGLCKPQFPVRSLTSRKSAPLTLFSTS